MKLSKIDVNCFAVQELNTFKLSNIVLDTKLALKTLEEEIVSEWDELNSLEVMGSRNNYFSVPNTKSSDYAERLAEFSDDKKVIYGIRHMGGNKELPFINIKPNFDIKSFKEVSEISETLKNEHSAFKPLYLSFWSPREMDEGFVGSTCVVTKSEVVKALQPWESEESLELKKVKDDTYYD
jgi:hypothetical protein